MRAFREQDFDQMAERVVDRFMDGDKLADAATQEAMGGSLNPDQIARLAQSANTMAFLRLMEQQKAQGGHDMTSEFDPIDARQIIQQLVSSANVPHMDGGGTGEPGMHPDEAPSPMGMDPDMGPLPDEMGHGLGGNGQQPPMQPGDDGDDGDVDDGDDDGPFPKGKKQKADDAGKKDKKDKKKSPFPPKKDEPKEAAFRERRMRKFADVLEDQYRQAEWAFEDTLANLSRQLKTAHGAPTMEAFEKDALALHGHDVGFVVLNMVRGDRGLAPLDFDTARSKVAALADRHVVEETEVVRTFNRLVKIADEALKLQNGAFHVRSLCS